MRRAIFQHAVPLYVVKVHPIKIFQLLSITKVFTSQSDVPVPGLKEVSREPSVLSRTKPFRVTPLYDEKFPPTIILLSDWIAIHEYTVPLSHVPTLKEVSREPSLLRRAMRFREVQL